MTTGITLAIADLTVGDVVAAGHYALTRDSLVRYAGASGDFNAIHYRDDVAASVGLPGVLAHGMLTMGLAVQCVIDWIGDPGRVLDYQVRFTRPVLVDAVDGAELSVSAKIGKIDTEAATARIDLVVTFGGDTVLGKSQAVVSLAPTRASPVVSLSAVGTSPGALLSEGSHSEGSHSEVSHSEVSHSEVGASSDAPRL